MKIFLDSAEVQEIRDCAQTGLIDGVTTNPSLIAKSGHSIQKVIEEICHLIPGPVSAEVIGTTFEEMTREGLELREIAPNVVIKVPLTVEGLKACRFFRERDIGVNVTLCFSASQALLAAKAGASFVSPFIGRLDDVSFDGLMLIEEICHIYGNYPALTTEVLAASIRHPIHVIQAAKVGADVVTLPAKIFKQLYEHPLTEKGLRSFLADWEKASQKGG